MMNSIDEMDFEISGIKKIILAKTGVDFSDFEKIIETYTSDITTLVKEELNKQKFLLTEILKLKESSNRLMEHQINTISGDIRDISNTRRIRDKLSGQ